MMFYTFFSEGRSDQFRPPTNEGGFGSSILAVHWASVLIGKTSKRVLMVVKSPASNLLEVSMTLSALERKGLVRTRNVRIPMVLKNRILARRFMIGG